MTAAVAEQEVPAGGVTLSRVCLTLFLACGLVVGWLPGRCWRLLGDFLVAVRIGYLRGVSRGESD